MEGGGSKGLDGGRDRMAGFLISVNSYSNTETSDPKTIAGTQ